MAIRKTWAPAPVPAPRGHKACKTLAILVTSLTLPLAACSPIPSTVGPGAVAFDARSGALSVTDVGALTHAANAALPGDEGQLTAAETAEIKLINQDLGAMMAPTADVDAVAAAGGFQVMDSDNSNRNKDKEKKEKKDKKNKDWHDDWFRGVTITRTVAADGTWTIRRVGPDGVVITTYEAPVWTPLLIRPLTDVFGNAWPLAAATFESRTVTATLANGNRSTTVITVARDLAGQIVSRSLTETMVRADGRTQTRLRVEGDYQAFGTPAVWSPTTVRSTIQPTFGGTTYVMTGTYVPVTGLWTEAVTLTRADGTVITTTITRPRLANATCTMTLASSGRHLFLETDANGACRGWIEAPDGLVMAKLGVNAHGKGFMTFLDGQGRPHATRRLFWF